MYDNKIALVLIVSGFAMLAFAGTDDAAAARSRIICTMEYAPVCGLARNGVRMTYANSCVARVSRHSPRGRVGEICFT